MSYLLERESDGAGDSGPMSEILEFTSDGLIRTDKVRPEVGYHVRVGAPYTRSYQDRDHWTTTEVTEILEDREGFVRFRTRNSVYIWRCP